MIFGPELLPLVLSGRKTETRRRVRPGEIVCRYRPGRDYAVQARRGGSALGRIQIVSVNREHLRDLDDAGARREGFADCADFRRYWRARHGGYDELTEVWAIAFRRVRPCVWCRRMTPHLYDSAVDPDLDPVPACDPVHLRLWLAAVLASAGDIPSI